MPPKRPSEGPAADHAFGSDASKRARTTAASAGQPGAGPVPSQVTPPASSIQAQIEAAKARAAALMARTAARNVSSPADANAQQGAAAPRPGNGAANSQMANVRPTATTADTPARFDAASIQQKMAEAKKRAAELAKGRFGIPNAAAGSSERPPSSGIHPLLMNTGNASQQKAASTSSSANHARHMAPKHSIMSSNANQHPSHVSSSFASTSRVEAPIVNPYLSIASEQDDIAQTLRGRARRRQMRFNAPGKYIRAAEEAKQEAQMEELKRRIEEKARDAGLAELTAEERALRRAPPPDVEWWDQSFLPDPTSYTAGPAQGKPAFLILGEGSPIDVYIQHPIPIPAPSDKIKIEPRGVMLTKKEQKKMRRMRRRAEQEDKQDKIKMGLLPPDPPKVKLSNLMRVLTSEAVADPTKVEARVRREVAARQDKHEQDNLERMLTPEQRRAKLEEGKQKDLAKGLYTIIFKVRHLISPSHKFKVRKNALQNALTGMALFGKDFALVLVEGGQKGIKAYRHLMTNRINWHDPGRPKADEGDELLADFNGDDPAGSTTHGSNDQSVLADVDWTENYCKVLFEGPVRDRRFPHGFKARQCEADIDAKEALGPRMASYWDLAKRQDRALEDDLA